MQEAPATDFEPDAVAVETRAAGPATAVAEAPEVESDASARDESEETPENVETASEADQPAPASPKTSRRRRAAGEEGND